MLPFSPFDLVALAFFVGAWIAYAVALEHTPHGDRSLNSILNRYREVWMREMVAREVRIVDTQIMAALQNGTAFFASTSLIAIGGALSILRSPDEVLALVATLPFGTVSSRLQWEAKVVGLAVVLVYAFFKFAWSYRLFNYVAIMLGATPPVEQKDTPEAAAHAHRTAGLLAEAGRHFNRGQRAFFLALGYLGWFVGPAVLIVTTSAVLVVMWRRQFASDARRAVAR